LVDISSAGSQQGGDDAMAVMGEGIAVSAGQLSDQAVSAQ
jgi:hypothetical protein